jgi:hypothetical protein
MAICITATKANGSVSVALEERRGHHRCIATIFSFRYFDSIRCSRYSFDILNACALHVSRPHNNHRCSQESQAFSHAVHRDVFMRGRTRLWMALRSPWIIGISSFSCHRRHARANMLESHQTVLNTIRFQNRTIQGSLPG